MHQRTIKEVQDSQNQLFDKYAPVGSSLAITDAPALGSETSLGLLNVTALKKVNFQGFDEIKKMLRL